MQARNQLLQMAAQDRGLAQVRANGQDDNPTFKINVDREKAAALGVALSDIDQTFSIAWARASATTFSIPATAFNRGTCKANRLYALNPKNLNLSIFANT